MPEPNAQGTTPVLELRGAGCRGDGRPGTALEGVDLDLLPGEAALVTVGRGVNLVRFVLADLAQGLVPASEGEVRFRGRDWATAGPAESSRWRGETGRVFAASSWLSNLNIDENVTLAARHHTDDPPAAIAAAAAELSARFDLSPPPPLRPAAESAERLRRYEWVRAFMGRPRLILLENPFSGVYSDHRGMFHAAVAGMVGAGAALVWITDEPATLPEPGTLPARRYRLQGTALVLQD